MQTILAFQRSLEFLQDCLLNILMMLQYIDSDALEMFDGDVKKFVNEVLVGKQHYLKRYLVVILSSSVADPDPVESGLFE